MTEWNGEDLVEESWLLVAIGLLMLALIAWFWLMLAGVANG